MDEYKLLDEIIELEEEINSSYSLEELCSLKEKLRKIRKKAIINGFNEVIFRTDDDLNRIQLLILDIDY